MKLDELQRLTEKAPDLQGPQLQQWLQQQLADMGLDANEMYQELEMSSRFADIHRDISHSGSRIQLHSHTFYELIYCITNCGAEYLVGSRRYRLQQGDIIFLPPGVSHRPLLPEHMDQPYERYVLWLSQEFMELFSRLLTYSFTDKQTQTSMLRTRGTPWEHLGAMFCAGVEEAERKRDGWEAAVLGQTIQLLVEIKRATDARSLPSMREEKPDLVDRITAYIESRYTGKITIDDLSRHFFVSSSTISHLFKQKMGVSICQYVTQRRLIAAKTLIEKGVLLEEICTRTGFVDYSGFYRAFRRAYGISPRQYRSKTAAWKGGENYSPGEPAASGYRSDSF